MDRRWQRRVAGGGSPKRRSPGCRCTCGSSSSSPRPARSNVSSEELADLAGVNAAKVRKDLSYLGTYGTRGVGYEVEYLIYQVRRELGLTHDWPVVIVGAGNLGQALAGYGGFGQRGFPVAGIVDIDDAKVDTVIGGVRVRRLDELAAIVRTQQVSIGVVATPGGRPPRRPPTASSRPASRAS